MGECAVPGVYIRQGKYSEAEPLCQRALAIDEKALGPNHPNVATNLNNLAELYRAQGKYSEAESLYQRALAIDESIGAESMDLPLPHKREFEVVIMIESATGEMVGTDRNTARKITREPWYGFVAWIDSIRAKWRSSPSAYGSTPTTTLDRADVVRDGRVTVSFAAQPIAKCPAKTFDTP